MFIEDETDGSKKFDDLGDCGHPASNTYSRIFLVSSVQVQGLLRTNKFHLRTTYALPR